MLNILEINDFSAPELDIYARRTEAQLVNKDNPEAGLFIAESPKVIGRALDVDYIPVSVLVEKHQMEENEETRQILERFEGIDVPIFTAEFEVLTKLTGFKLTRGMLCAMKRKPLLNYQDMCAGKDRIVILENVMNPTNVGAIFRSAAALNMDAVIHFTGEPQESVWERFFRFRGHLFRTIMKCVASGRYFGPGRRLQNFGKWVIRLQRLR